MSRLGGAFVLLLFPLCLSSLSCIQDDGNRWHPLRRFELINLDDERELGMEFDRNLRDLDQAMAVAQEEYDQYVRSRQAATHSYVGYDQPINQLRAESSRAAQQIDLLMERQGRLLEIVAIDELMARRSRLEVYGDKARFALADSYDRATRTQAKVDE